MAKKFYLISIVCALSLATSCTSNFPYIDKPQEKTPEKWDAKNTALNTNIANLQCVPWWRQFKDPVLEDLIHKGLKCNHEVNIALANIDAVQGELKRVKYNWFPGLDSLLGYTSFPYLGYPGVIAVLLPTYTINIFKQYKEQKQATHNLHVAKNIRDTVRLTIIAQVAGTYFNYQAQVERLELLKAVEEDLQRRVGIYQATYQNALSSDIQLVRAQSDLELLKSEINTLQQNIVISQNMLRMLIAENPHKFNFPTKFSQLDNHQELVGNTPLNVVENRPDMQKATNELLAANAGIGVAAGDFIPSIQLNMGRGDIGTVPYGKTLGQPVYFNESLLKTSLIKIPAFGELEKARGIGRVYFHKYLLTYRKVLQEINTDLSANELYTQRLQHTNIAKNNLYKNYSLNNSLFKQGIISYLDLLDDKIKYDKVKIELNQRKLEQLMTIVTLYQDMAVGYGCA